MHNTFGIDSIVRGEITHLLLAARGQLVGSGSYTQSSRRTSGHMIQVSTGGGACEAILTRPCAKGSHVGTGQGNDQCDVVLTKECPAGGYIGHGPDHPGHGPELIIVGVVTLAVAIVVSYFVAKKVSAGNSRN